MVRKDESTMQGSRTPNVIQEEKNEKIAETVDPSYDAKVDAIQNSNKSEVRKTAETREANEELIRKTAEEISRLKPLHRKCERSRSYASTY